jgi:hypothetical protein
MAEIDKSLTDIKKTVEIAGPEEQVEVQQEINESLPNAGETEITPTEDGGVEINFEPGAFNQAQSENHFDNLAELLPEEILGPLGSELNQNYMDYKESRKEWEHTYITGLDLLGFKYEDRTEPFSGAAGATHPVLAEAVTQFQALAYKELLPADGPIRTQIIGAPSPDKEMQSTRVKDFMNYQLMDQMKEYEPEFDQLLFYLPLAGSAFKKVYYDSLLGRAVSKFVPAEDLVVPYSATSLEDATAVVHVIKTKENDLRKQQVSGFYRDVDLGAPAETESDLERKERELEGITKTKDEDVYNILEFHVDLDLEGFEDRGPDGQPTGIKLPYIVTIEEASREVLSIRRNYEINDPQKKKISYFVHFKFLPGLGFYGFGLIHMIGGLSRTATAALRSLLDAGTLSNLPAGFKMRGIRIRDDAQSITPGEFRDVDAPGGNIKDAFMALPFKEPSQTLLQLMGVVVSAGQRFASIADLQVGDGNQQAAVGTTVALLEKGSRTMSAIHKRIYVSLKNEFKMLARVFKLYLPDQYPYDVVGGQRFIKKADFDDRVDILPVADPNIFSQTQRISIAQAELQLAQSNPQMHNLYNAYRAMYEALGVKNIDMILKPVPRPQPMDPSVEAIQALAGQPFQAFKGQDHRAHITAHLNFMTSSMARNNPMVTAAMQKNIFEHISLMALEQVEVEFKDQIIQMQQMQQQMKVNPALAQDPQLQQQMMAINMQIESRKAVLIAEMFEDFAKEEQQLMGEYGNDPIAKLKARELDIRAKDDFVKAEQAQEKINLDRMKAFMNQQNKDEKLEQNEELAELRAATSLAKQEMANRSKIHDFGRNFKKK